MPENDSASGDFQRIETPRNSGLVSSRAARLNGTIDARTCFPAVRARVLTEEMTRKPHPSARPGDARASKPEDSAGWERVRDSWVDVPPGVAGSVCSEPPPLPASVRELPAERSPVDAALADRMLEQLARGDYEAALIAAEALLHRLPRDADALDCAEMSRKELRERYVARLGGVLHRVPSVVTREAIATLTLDAFTAFLLSRIDGLATLHEIAFAQGMSPEHALRVLSEFYLKGVIALR
jgi:hypothetical protein